MMAIAHDPLEALDVSRETIERLRQFVSLLEKWNPAINLVSRNSIAEAWTRHVLDSAQLYTLAPLSSLTWLDLGSGGGFPGLVSAIIGLERQPDAQHVLVEVDQRKSTFLRSAIQLFGLNAVVLTNRIEALPPQNAQVITARALAPLPQLCALAHRHLALGGLCLFQKGANHLAEVADASKIWRMTLDLIPSLTDPEAVILKVSALDHV